MTATAFLSILGIHLLAVASPGPSFLLTVRTAASQGFAAAAELALGLGLGAMVWGVVALLGLHLVLEAAPMLLRAIEVAGAAYLLWIAWKSWTHAAEPMREAAAGPAARGRPLATGVLSQLGNPKAALFFGAIFVGMVPPGTSALTLGLLLLAMLLDGVAWYALVGRLFSLPTPRAAYARLKIWIDRAFALVLAALAVALVLPR